MNNQLRTFYIIILDNKAVYYDTAIKKLYEVFVKIEPGIGHYRTFLKKFKPTKDEFINEFTLTLSGKTYHFQKLV